MKKVTIHFGSRSATIEVSSSATVRDVLSNAPLKALLGYPDAVQMRFANSVLEPSVIIPADSVLHVESQSNTKG